MFKSTITLFNYLYSSDEYSKTLINNVEIQPMCSTHPQTNSTQSNTKVLIIVPYKVDSAGAYVNDGNDKKYYLKPKVWANKVDPGIVYVDKKSGERHYLKQKGWAESIEYFTIQSGLDFIIVGDYSYLTDVNLNEIRNTIPDVFVIGGVKDFSDDLKHFEIMCN